MNKLNIQKTFVKFFIIISFDSGQMQKENQKNMSSLFTEYYNSCLQYEDIDRIKRIELGMWKLDIYLVSNFKYKFNV